MEVSTRQYDWSRAGMAIIAHLIRGTIAYNKRNGLTPQSYRDFEGTSHTTVRNYSLCTIENPQQKDTNAASLAAIAPHLYRFVTINGDEVMFDPEKKYSNWQELAEHMQEVALDLDEPHDYRVLPAPRDGLQLRLTKQSDQTMLGLMLEQITALRKDIEWLKRFAPQSTAQPIVVRAPVTPMETFLHGWCEKASAEQLADLSITATDWASQREQVLDALTRDGMVERTRAEEILQGTELKPAEELLLCYLFHAPVSKTAYPRVHWANLSQPEMAIAG